MLEDRQFCCDAFLMYRYIVDENKSFRSDIKPFFFKKDHCKYHINGVDDIADAIKSYIDEILSLGGKIGLALSGGIDSAILAKYVPKDTMTYTFRCVAPGTVDETAQAKVYAQRCNLQHTVVDVTWQDYLESSKVLMAHKGAPIHSIEPQIFKAATLAREQGVTHMLFGENADIIFGGMDGLLKKDWSFNEFVERYSYINPSRILKNGTQWLDPFEKYRHGDKIDFYGFITEFFYLEANNSYENACATAGVKYASPFNRMSLDFVLDYDRIRKGDTKYLLRQLFNKLYPDLGQPVKIPMPRAVSQWLETWEGPTRQEFIPNCISGLNADQKWMVFILERFLNQIDVNE